jgi:TetR/AcrR family transcriptional regulator, repressor of fatR-cypB operon
MPETANPPVRPTTDKRAALLAAAKRLIARSGLHATPTAAVAREAGVAAGTLFLYFPNKDALINALYLELLEEQYRAAAPDAATLDPAAPPSAQLWHSWQGLARWYLEHRDASRALHQCKTSGVLTAETRAAEQRAREEGLERFREAIARGVLRDLPSSAFWALYAGPILALADARDAGEVAVTEEVLRVTFEGVCRGVLP